ncbi:MAG: hypothetical protein JW715_04360 [Sedimentisphaerales bacterium]|nr:hypothetical protein [Sedimentisphaerales bacterium]
MLLPPKDASLFISLYSSLIGFAAGRLGGVEGIDSLESFISATNEDRAGARDELLNNIGLIDEFVKVNPHTLSPKELSSILKFKNFISGNFFVERDLKNYTVFLHDDETPQAYGVLGLTDEIVEMIPHPLPACVSAVLLPWKDKIICDGLILTYSIHLGDEMKEKIKQSYLRAKKHGIITSLESRSTK